MFFIKLFFKKRYGVEKATTFFNGDRFILINNISCSLIILIVGLVDLVFRGNEFAYYLGLGTNIWILALIPFLLFTKYGPNNIEISHIDEPDRYEELQ